MIDIPYPLAFWLCMCIALLAAAMAWRIRAIIGWWPVTLVAATLLLGALAAGGIRVLWTSQEPTLVLVDLSQSTRGAEYRDPPRLRERLDRLLNGHTYEIRDFDSEGPPTPTSPALLFSDGQFGEWRPATPVWPVIDPALARAEDARLVAITHERGQTIAIVENSGNDRRASVDDRNLTIPRGRSRVLLGEASQSHRIQIEPGDRWPENDGGEALQWPGEAMQRWTVGVVPLGNDQLKSPENLPDNPAGYLSTSLLTIDAASATRLGAQQQRAITTWVRDMGGALLVIAGDASWPQLRGTAIEKISPLSVDPPEPAAQWIVLLDFSGSMAANSGVKPKWQRGVTAAAALVGKLPQRDLVRLGSFAGNVSWWDSAPAGQLNIVVPAGQGAHGPTNLEVALESALMDQSKLRREIVLLTDAEVELPHLAELQKRFQTQQARVYCLLLSDGRGAAALEQLCRATGGILLPERTPELWSDAARRLAGEAAPARWNLQPVEARTTAPLQERTIRVAGWNSAWLRNGARAFASAGERTLAADWQIELGRVATLAWSCGREDLLELASSLQRRPINTGFSVKWPGMADAKVEVDFDLSLGNQPPREMNVRVAPAGDGEVRTTPLEKKTPGRYEGLIPGTEAGAYLTIMADGKIVARGAVPPSYPREFAAIGIDRDRLAQVASDSGGSIIEKDHAIDIRPRQRWIHLRSILGVCAAGLLAIAVLLARRKL